ncbi:MAG: FliH/SctL family protein [Rhodobiaceae bacterium]
MSSGTTSSERLTETLDAAVAEDAQQGRLDDTEIQRLVVLSRDASYQPSERVPVKTVEVFEPRSLVSIAMDAQRRRETEMRTAAAAGAVIDTAAAAADLSEGEAAAGGPSPETPEAGPTAGNGDVHAAGESEQAALDDAGETSPTEADGEPGGEEAATQGNSQIDFEAGREAGLEEGRKSGFEDGHAKGLEEGRAAGRAGAAAQLERASQAVESAAGRLGDMTEIDSSALGESIHNTILTLASERAGRAIAEQPGAFADRIEGLLAAIRTASGQPVIHLNPGDLGSIQPLVETREKLRHCSFVAAPDLAAGDLTVTVGTIGIDDFLLPSSPEPVSAHETTANAPMTDSPAPEGPEPDPEPDPSEAMPDIAETSAEQSPEQSPEQAAGEGIAGTDVDTDAQTGGSDD